MPRATQLYRYFDIDGNLLYIGISVNFMVRASQHKSSSRWFDRISYVNVTHFPNRELAISAERVAISNEMPLYNKQRAQLPKSSDGDYIYIRLDKKTKMALRKVAKKDGSNMTIWVRQLVLRELLTKSPEASTPSC